MESKKEEWPVEIYRKTTGRGWERALVSESVGQVMATPCVGGVEIRKFRVRIRAFPKKNEQESKRNRGQSGIARAVRRKKTIYFPSQRGNGSIVLKFQDVTDSIAFFDRLADLNIPNRFSMPPTVSNDPVVKHNDNGSPSKKVKNTKRDEDPDREDLEANERNSLLHLLARKDESIANRRKTDAMFYIARLMHDEDFLSFVDQIEENLNSTDDGAKMLRAFQQPPTTDEMNVHQGDCR
jgi:hypothetical protein